MEQQEFQVFVRESLVRLEGRADASEARADQTDARLDRMDARLDRVETKLDILGWLIWYKI